MALLLVGCFNVPGGMAQDYSCKASLQSVRDVEFCGDFAYHPAEHVCCNGVLNERTGGNNACCNDEWVHVDNCCNGVPVDPTNGTACCFGNIYDPESRACCADGNTLAIGSNQFYNFQCCHNEDSNSNTLYDVTLSTCCGGVVRSKPSSPSVALCCEDGSYFSYDSTNGNRACCETSDGFTTYDTSTDRCCSEGPVPLPDTINSYICCGAELVRTDMFDCCDDIPHEKQDDHMCCGEEYYDVSSLTYPTCCDETLYDNAVSSLSCCVSTVYNNRDSACVLDSCRRCGENEDCDAAVSAAHVSSASSVLAATLAAAFVAVAFSA